MTTHIIYCSIIIILFIIIRLHKLEIRRLRGLNKTIKETYHRGYKKARNRIIEALIDKKVFSQDNVNTNSLDLSLINVGKNVVRELIKNELKKEIDGSFN